MSPACPDPAASAIASRRRRESGSNAIEFALVLPLFLLLLYGSASYAFIFVIQQALTFAAEEGVRAAIVADPADPAFDTLVTDRARTAVADALGWLPEERRLHVLGTGNESVEVTLAPAAGGDWSVEVAILYANYPDNGLVLPLVLPGLGSVPPLPQDLRGTATGRL